MADVAKYGRPTWYCGVKMRSRTEADFAASIDETGWAWEYEPRCFASRGGQYLPDFYVIRPGMPDQYVEVKPVGMARQAIDAALRKMAIIWESEPAADLLLIEWDYAKHRCEWIWIREAGHSDWDSDSADGWLRRHVA